MNVILFCSSRRSKINLSKVMKREFIILAKNQCAYFKNFSFESIQKDFLFFDQFDELARA